MSDERTPATLVCAARVEPEQLSAWRDGLLSEDQAAWLTSHVAGCPACSERLRDYERIGSALRGQMIPQPNGDLWPATQRLIASGGRRRRWWPVGAPSWGTWGAVAAAALLVALFAGLLMRQLPHRHGAPATATPTATLAPTEIPTATSTPIGGAWTQVASFGQAPNPPAALATQYDVFSGQDSKGTAPYFRFRRSDDFGQTWVNLSPPQIAGVKYPDNVSTVTGIMSPLDPKTYILTLQLENVTCPQANAQFGRMCQVQYVTQDGGATWTLLSLPAKGLVALAWPFGEGAFPLDLSVQGTRLYSTVNEVMFAASGAIPPGRLVASYDGGATWSLVDSALNAKQLMVYDMTATPTGSTVFALAGVPDPNLMPGQLPPLSLWRSDDAGVNWHEVIKSVQNFEHMRASSDASTGKSILYRVAGDKYSTMHLYASADGGASWKDSGVSAQIAVIDTLPDGSLLFATGSDVERWDGRTGAPHIVAQATGLDGLFTNALAQSNPDGKVTIWLTGMGPSSRIQEYTTISG